MEPWETMDSITDGQKHVSSLLTSTWRALGMPNPLGGRMVEWNFWVMKNTVLEGMTRMCCIRDKLYEWRQMEAVPIPEKKMVPVEKYLKDLYSWKEKEEKKKE